MKYNDTSIIFCFIDKLFTVPSLTKLEPKITQNSGPIHNTKNMLDESLENVAEVNYFGKI